MVTMVLLNEAFTCATPEVMFLRSRFLTRAGSLAIDQPLLFLLAGDRLGRTLAVTQAAIAGQVHQALDVDGGLAAQVAFDLVVAVNGLADVQHFLVSELVDPARILDVDLADDLPSLGRADPMDVLQRYDDALV